MNFTFASAVAFSAVCSAFLPWDSSTFSDCPRGALYLVTTPDLRGACGVTFVDDGLLVTTPEALTKAHGGAADRASQLIQVDWAA
ncbi:MAG: hypothetical protein RL591_2529, partial [Planctomycetota bacterium]